MSTIITIAIRKGGSGKTTTAVNLASALTLRGLRTLLVDLDHSANATTHVGINPYTLTRSLHTLFTDITATPQSVMYSTSYGLSVLPATGDLEQHAPRYAIAMRLPLSSSPLLQPCKHTTRQRLGDHFQKAASSVRPSPTSCHWH